MAGMPGELLSEVSKRPRRWAVVGALVLAAIVVIGALAVWAVHSAKNAADRAEKRADRAEKRAEELKDELKQAHADRREAEEAARRAEAAESRSQASRKDSADAMAFLRDKLLSAGRPAKWTDPPDHDITLREAVDAADSQVAAALADRPLAEAIVRSTLGRTYFYLGEADRAAKQYQQALTLRTGELGADDPLTVGTRNDLARALRAAGRDDEAARLFDYQTKRSKE